MTTEPRTTWFAELPPLAVRATLPTTWDVVSRALAASSRRLGGSPSPTIRFFAAIDPNRVRRMPPAVRAAMHLETFEATLGHLGHHVIGSSSIAIRLDGPLASDVRVAATVAHECHHRYRHGRGWAFDPADSAARAEDERAADAFARGVLGDLGLPIPRYFKEGVTP